MPRLDSLLGNWRRHMMILFSAPTSAEAMFDRERNMRRPGMARGARSRGRTLVLWWLVSYGVHIGETIASREDKGAHL